VPEPELLEVTGLSKYFAVKAGGTARGCRRLRAVHNVSFTLGAGRTLGLVGESGCGKSTTGRLVLRLIEPSSGSIRMRGTELTRLRHNQLKPWRQQMQIVFQDPLSSLNPRLCVGSLIGEPLLVHGMPRGERQARVEQLLREVELPPDSRKRYAHEFSGGQRQRIAIARALALNPALLVADEPVSALDASIQSQVLQLLGRLQAEHSIAMLFISHDLAVVRYLSDFVAIMYLGQIVEYGPTAQVYADPRHPYTRALLAAIPRPEPHATPVQPLAGSLPSAVDPPTGCSFASRCPHVQPRCLAQEVPVFHLAGGHSSRCWLNEGAASAVQTGGPEVQSS
jgi:oligopeptide/dipeptide ABC transporter ATP-binding protein